MKVLHNELYKKDIEYIMGLNLPWGMFKDKSVIITGANGMIGKCIIDVLMFKNIGIKIIAIDIDEQKAMERFSGYIDSDNFKFIKCDINKRLEEMGRAEFVIHTTNNMDNELEYLKPIEMIISDINGTNNILEYATNHGNIRFLFISSGKVYGENRGDTEKFKENYCGYLDCNTLKDGYAESKRAGEALCQAYIKEKALDVVIARLAKVYGSTMQLDNSNKIAQFIKSGIKKTDIVLKNEENELCSYIYLADAVAGILTILLKGECKKAYNVADEGSNVSLKDLAKIIVDYIGKKVVSEVVADFAEGSASKIILDAKKLEDLDWTPHYNITTGLKRTVDILSGCEKVNK